MASRRRSPFAVLVAAAFTAACWAQVPTFVAPSQSQQAPVVQRSEADDIAAAKLSLVGLVALTPEPAYAEIGGDALYGVVVLTVALVLIFLIINDTKVGGGSKADDEALEEWKPPEPWNEKKDDKKKDDKYIDGLQL
eukprot:TRINITY_DN4850_c0_g2_i1.p1 TRINITY_DN4850_c0_g2~~TRINITY_DN4850_c0_g2_i1.p1  ORF type:complete len:155 (-),score=46.72 TRINITY_DN4850_c0_g2_i1:76-486(-)